MQNARFSIIIPIYNAQKFIARALQSALSQSYKHIEIICVDDASTDRSVEICKEFALKDSRIKILQNPQNLGTFATRNIGALSASGEYLFFVDSDDSLEVNALEVVASEILRYKQQGQGVDMLAFNHCMKAHNGEVSNKILYPQNQIFSVRDFVLWLCKRGVGKYWAVWGKAFLRTAYVEALRSLGDLATHKRLLMAEDALNVAVFLMRSNTCACINEVLYCYCENEDSITQREDKATLELSIENHCFVVGALRNVGAKSGVCAHAIARIFACELEISSLNESRKLNRSAWCYVRSSLQKKILRFKQWFWARKLHS